MTGSSVFKLEQVRNAMRAQSSLAISREDLLEALHKLEEDEFLTLSGPPNNLTIAHVSCLQ